MLIYLLSKMILSWGLVKKEKKNMNFVLDIYVVIFKDLISLLVLLLYKIFIFNFN